MASFKDQAQKVYETDDYRGKLQAYLDKCKSHKHPQMTPKVFELGVALQNFYKAYEWGAWMRGVEVAEYENEVIFYVPSEFSRQWIQNNFGFNIGVHYKKAVRFRLPEAPAQQNLGWDGY